jgi:hypothetical protein
MNPPQCEACGLAGNIALDLCEQNKNNSGDKRGKIKQEAFR